MLSLTERGSIHQLDGFHLLHQTQETPTPVSVDAESTYHELKMNALVWEMTKDASPTVAPRLKVVLLIL